MGEKELVVDPTEPSDTPETDETSLMIVIRGARVDPESVTIDGQPLTLPPGEELVEISEDTLRKLAGGLGLNQEGQE